MFEFLVPNHPFGGHTLRLGDKAQCEAAEGMIGNKKVEHKRS